jgi:hypothetical protein
VTPAMFGKMVGVNSQYAIASLEADKIYLDRGKSYKLHLPPNVFFKTFWSIVLYDPQTRSELQNSAHLGPAPALVRQDLATRRDRTREVIPTL